MKYLIQKTDKFGVAPVKHHKDKEILLYMDIQSTTQIYINPPPVRNTPSINLHQSTTQFYKNMSQNDRADHKYQLNFTKTIIFNQYYY